ncbi:hypothetical protein Tco_0371850 [Tanacetum coccineum]
MLQPLKNQSVVRKSTAFKSERPKSSKPLFASQVDVNNDLPKPITTHYFPREREFAFAKPHHMIAPRSSSSSLWIQDHDNEPSSSMLVPKVVPPVNTLNPSLQELELLFGPMYEEYFTAGN